MKKEFVAYNIAKRLKDMGFDEDCLAYYDPNKELHLINESVFNYSNLSRNSGWQDLIAAPLWQQITRWLRDVHKINVTLDFFPNVKKWSSFSYSQNLNGKEYVKERSMKKFMEITKYDTYEEALESEIINIVNHWKTNEKES